MKICRNPGKPFDPDPAPVYTLLFIMYLYSWCVRLTINSPVFLLFPIHVNSTSKYEFESHGHILPVLWKDLDHVVMQDSIIPASKGSLIAQVSSLLQSLCMSGQRFV